MDKQTGKPIIKIADELPLLLLYSGDDKTYYVQTRLERASDALRDLIAENKRLREALQTALNIYALQAHRDSADPDMLSGWRDLQAKAKAALKGE